MRRRELLIGLAAATTVRSHRLRAQQRTVPVIGYLSTASIEARPNPVLAFRKGLAGEGFIEGRNVTVTYRSADSHAVRLPELAADLVRHQVEVIACDGSPATHAAMRATSSIPIVFAVAADPVRMGLVPRLNRPGGNVTGFFFLVTELVAKRLALLHEMLPLASRIAALVNPATPATTDATLRNLNAAASALGLEIRIFSAGTVDEIDAAFGAIATWRADAVFVGPDAFFGNQRQQIASLAARHGLPASLPHRDYVEAGGLVSYGPNVPDSFRHVGEYVGRILKGDRPGDLPVVQPTRYALVLNLRTAKSLGIEFPATLLAIADEVIE